MALARVATRDVDWYDQVVPEGSVLVPIHAATGRDQRQFRPIPTSSTSNASIERHLSFGFGVHVCMGAPLARIEAPDHARGDAARGSPSGTSTGSDTEIVHTGSSVRGYSKLPITVG